MILELTQFLNLNDCPPCPHCGCVGSLQLCHSGLSKYNQLLRIEDAEWVAWISTFQDIIDQDIPSDAYHHCMCPTIFGPDPGLQYRSVIARIWHLMLLLGFTDFIAQEELEGDCTYAGANFRKPWACRVGTEMLRPHQIQMGPTWSHLCGDKPWVCLGVCSTWSVGEHFEAFVGSIATCISPGVPLMLGKSSRGTGAKVRRMPKQFDREKQKHGWTSWRLQDAL